MKRLISKIKPLFEVYFGDFLLIIMLVLILITALEKFQKTYVKVALCCVVFGFVKGCL